jgi:hypothetical protein
MDIHPDFYMEYSIGPVAIDMPTAILRMRIPQGFVVVADGRTTNSLMEPVEDGDAAQKIFDIGGGGHHIACSLAGAVQPSSFFHFAKEIVRVSPDLSTRKCRNLFGYAVRLSTEVNKSLHEAKRAGLIKEFPTGVSPDQTPGANEGIATVFLDAFYNGTPQRASIIFRHKDQRLLSPDVVAEPATVGVRLVLGADAVTDLFFDSSDHRFAAYRTESHKKGPQKDPTLDDIGNYLKGYIAACSDPEALKLNPRCAMIGGRVHIAEVTPEGFRWQIPPLGIQA